MVSCSDIANGFEGKVSKDSKRELMRFAVERRVMWSLGWFEVGIEGGVGIGVVVVCGEERVMYVCDGCTMMELGRGCLVVSAFGSGVACQRVLRRL